LTQNEDSLIGDPTRLSQILINLWECKFTEKGYVELVVSQRESETDTFIRFTVTDTGIGR
jgi:signal transduction histidine kinase